MPPAVAAPAKPDRNTASSDRQPGRNAPAIPLAGLVDGITLVPGMTTGLTTSEAAPFAPALAEIPEARCAGRYALKVRHSRLLSSPEWISLFNTLGQRLSCGEKDRILKT